MAWVTSGGVQWTVSSKVYTIKAATTPATGYTKGVMPDYGAYCAPWGTIGANESVVIDSSVTVIGKCAFYACTSSKSVDIPATVTEIHESAFQYCEATVNIPSSSKLKKIGKCAFQYCTGLVNLSLSTVTQLTTIEDQAFYDCEGLKTVYLPASLVSIGKQAFYNCTALTKAVLTTTDCKLSSIGEAAFMQCKALTTQSITLSTKLTVIPEEAFRNTALTKFQVSSTVIEVGYYSFAQTKITSLTIPKQLKSLDGGAFVKCASLASITVEEGTALTYVGPTVFALCTSLTSDGGLFQKVACLKVVPEWIFEDCTSLATVNLRSDTTKIGQGAFWDCPALKSITIPNTVTYIGRYAFCECGFDGTVTIPESVTEIADFAFRGNPNIMRLELLGKPTLGEQALELNIASPSDTYTLYAPKYTGMTETVPEYDYTKWYYEPTWNISGGIQWAYDKTNKKLLIKSTTTPESGYSTGVMKDYTSVGPWGKITTGGWNVQFDSSDIINIGNFSFNGCTAFKTVTIPTSVEFIGTKAFYGCKGITLLSLSNVQSIGSYAFSGCTGLLVITIPASVAEIKDHAFYGNTYSVSIQIYEGSELIIGDYAFSKCISASSITSGSVNIPSSVTSIGAHAFDGCTKWKGGLELMTTVTEVGAYAFANCSGLTSFTWNADANIPEGCFMNCTGFGVAEINDWMTSIGKKAFYGCTGIMEILIGLAVMQIGEQAFYGCTSLNGATLPSSVQSLGKECFAGCTSMIGSIFSDALYTIPEGCFKGCTSLTDVQEISPSLMAIGDYAFDGCKKLVNFGMPGSIEKIGQYAFRNCASWNTSLSFPGTLLTLGVGAFMNCTKITSLDLSGESRFYTIPKECFRGCTSLTSVTFSPEMQMIGDYAFYNCSTLTGTLEFPESFTSMGDYAFAYCRALTGFKFLGGKPTLWKVTAMQLNMYEPEKTYTVSAPGWASDTEFPELTYTKWSYVVLALSSFRLNTDGTWRTGTPYINIDGTWKKGTVYMNVDGTWKKGI